MVSLDPTLEDWLQLGGGDVPCQMVRSDDKPCGQPAVVRLRVLCTSCRGQSVFFFCERCYEEMKTGHASCERCMATGAVPDVLFKET